MERDLLKRRALDAGGGMPPPPPRPPVAPRRAAASDASAAPAGTTPSTAGSVPESVESEYSPVPWSTCFDTCDDVVLPGTEDVRFVTFRVYRAGSAGPVLYLFHGGGHTALSWALFAAILKAHCRIIAFDARGHGETKTADEMDLSAERQVADALALWSALFPDREASPSVVFVGHSMGGAIATRAAAHSARPPSLVGLVVLDVVEGTGALRTDGTSLAALPAMLSVLRARPVAFASPSAAIQWAIASGTLKNPKSAALSLPSQIRRQDDGHWVWRTDLFASEKHWKGWFAGLSSVFLSARCAKELILAGTDRLDKDLLIGQMQGKFQLVVLPAVGHVVQEDAPDRTAQTVLEFLRRNGFVRPS